MKSDKIEDTAGMLTGELGFTQLCSRASIIPYNYSREEGEKRKKKESTVDS